MNKLITIGVLALVIFVSALAMPSVASAQYTGCYYHAQQGCIGNSLYWLDSCGNMQDLAQYCPNGCNNNSCNNNCSYHSYESCQGNNLYWYDSCGNQQDLAQSCQSGCSNNACSYNGYSNNYNYNSYNYNSYNYNSNSNNYNNNSSSCTYHAYKLCSGNSVYWYDSCDNKQDLFSSCTIGQACQYGQCAAYVQPAPIQPYNNYVAHYRTACYGNSLYWYDSLGAASGLYKNCGADSTCKTNVCVANAPVVTPTPTPVPVKISCGNGFCEPNSGETITNCPNDCKINTTPAVSTISVSFFAKQDASSTQWQKAAQVGSNGQVLFMISLLNNSTTQIDNVNVSANIPSEISSLGNLQINGVSVAGDIITGINVGSIAPSTTKLVNFEGKTQTISTASAKQAIASSNGQTDNVSLDFSPSQPVAAVVAAVVAAPATTGFLGFLKRWYIWILAGLVLVLLFVVVFRRLSSTV